MTSPNKRHLWLIALLGICLISGLWAHDWLLVALDKRDEQRESWDQLTTRAGTVLSQLREFRQKEAHSGRDGRLRARARLLSTLSQERLGALVVDPRWRAVSVIGGPGGDAPEWQRGDHVAWYAAETGAAAGERRRGMLQTPNAAHPALACPLENGAGYAVLYTLDTGSASISPMSLIAAGAIWLVWTLGLQSLVVFLLFSRNPSEDRTTAAIEEAMLRRTQDLIRTRDAIIFALAKLAESRDPETGQHIERLSMYASCLALAASRHPAFRAEMKPGFVRVIGVSSVLHDIGKVGIEDSILLKPGRLTPSERQRMEEHAVIGGNCLRSVERRLGKSNFLHMAREITYYHHEKWDGSGYPFGLAGTDIPLAARIVAIVDVYDALSSRRVYKDAWTHEECVRHIREQAGKHFDPRLVEVFVGVQDRFREIARQYGDGLTASTDAVDKVLGATCEQPADFSKEQQETVAVDA